MTSGRKKEIHQECFPKIISPSEDRKKAAKELSLEDFSQVLCQSELFPLDVDHSSAGTEKFEKLHNVTLNLFSLKSQADSKDCALKLHECRKSVSLTPAHPHLRDEKRHSDLI